MKMREAPWTAGARRRLALLFGWGMKVVKRRRQAAAVQGAFGAFIFIAGA
jgi:hypothetical protein